MRSSKNAVVLNADPGAWAFHDHAQRLARALNLPIASEPAAYNYVLAWDEDRPLPTGRSFIPFDAMRLASDKRLLAATFAQARVPTPITHLLDTPDDVRHFLEHDPHLERCLKWPIACGASGHRLITNPADVPTDWPRPYVVQEFLRLDDPAVYRTYAAGGHLFGWNVRRFPPGTKRSDWVAHARGARYQTLDDTPPAEAAAAATAALRATGLLDSFGCADLMRRPTGQWVVLEVGTDGIYNHVDRDLADPAFERQLDERVATAFDEWLQTDVRRDPFPRPSTER